MWLPSWLKEFKQNVVIRWLAAVGLSKKEFLVSELKPLCQVPLLLHVCSGPLTTANLLPGVFLRGGGGRWVVMGSI